MMILGGFFKNVVVFVWFMKCLTQEGLGRSNELLEAYGENYGTYPCLEVGWGGDGRLFPLFSLFSLINNCQCKPLFSFMI